jgi:lysosomal-associated membrane protein 1/2
MEATGTMKYVVILLVALCAQSLSVENRTVDVTTVALDGQQVVVNGDESNDNAMMTTVLPAVTMPTTTTMPTETPVLPNKQRWNVTQKGSMCIMFETGIRMAFNYKNSTHNVTGAIVDVPVDAMSDGVCGELVQNLTLHFFSDWQLTISFTLNTSTNLYYMNALSLHYAFHTGRQPFPQAYNFNSTSAWTLDGDSFVTSVGTSYVCTSQQTMFENETLQSNVGFVRINFYDSWVEAFRGNNTSTEFAHSGGRCSDDELSLLIPIIVGACLAGLIVIVLVAYFIGRHHAKRGYENV